MFDTPQKYIVYIPDPLREEMFEKKKKNVKNKSKRLKRTIVILITIVELTDWWSGGVDPRANAGVTYAATGGEG